MGILDKCIDFGCFFIIFLGLYCFVFFCVYFYVFKFEQIEGFFVQVDLGLLIYNWRFIFYENGDSCKEYDWLGYKK